MEFLLGLDADFITFVNSFARMSIAFDRFILGVGRLDLFKGVVVTALLAYFWLVPEGRLVSPRMILARSAIGVVAAVALARGLQLLLPFRARPRHNPELEFTALADQQFEALLGWSSFPGDHAVVYFAVATAVFMVSRRAGVFAYLWTVFITCVPQIYVGDHYLSDLVAGALIGIIVMWVAFRVPLPAALPAFLGRWEDRHPLSLFTLAFLLAHQIATVFNDTRKIARYAIKVLTGIEL